MLYSQILRIDFWMSATRTEAVILGWDAPWARRSSWKQDFSSRGMKRVNCEYMWASPRRPFT